MLPAVRQQQPYHPARHVVQPAANQSTIPDVRQHAHVIRDVQGVCQAAQSKLSKFFGGLRRRKNGYGAGN